MAGEWIAILASLSFVLSNILFRKVDSEASPTFINSFRTFVGVITFVLIAVIYGFFYQIFDLSVVIWLLLILSFIFGQVIGDTAYFEAQKNLGTTKAMAISMTYPIFTYLLSMLFLGQEFELKFIISLVLIGSGVLVLGKFRKQNLVEKNDEESSPLSPNTSITKKSSIIAISFGLLASFGWAAGIVVTEYATTQIDLLLQTGSRTSILGNIIRFPAALLILLAMTYREDKHPFQNKSKKTWIILSFAALIGTSVGAFLYTEAVRTAGASKMALIGSANPLFALPLAYFINKEKISKFSFFGVLLIISGLIISLL